MSKDKIMIHALCMMMIVIMVAIVMMMMMLFVCCTVFVCVLSQAIVVSQ